MADPIRVFVGTEPKTQVAYKVLAHSIRAHTTRPVDITPMVGPAWEYPTDGIKVGTGFSLRRWMIPNACGWKGYAVYLDADQQVFGDVGQLYDLGVDLLGRPVSGPATLAYTWQKDKYYPRPAPQTSVMVIDCEQAQKHRRFDIAQVLAFLKGASKLDYIQFMHNDGRMGAASFSGPLPTEWNHLNVYEEGKTKLLHYTKEPEQPWYKPDHPLAYLWKQALSAALKAGAVTRGELNDALAKWGTKQDWRPTNGLHPAYKKWVKEAVA